MNIMVCTYIIYKYLHLFYMKAIILSLQFKIAYCDLLQFIDPLEILCLFNFQFLITDAKMSDV